MADSITSSKTLSIGVEYTEDKDTRTTTINIPNFRQSITEQQIKDVFTNQNVLIYGYDESGAAKPVKSENIVTASTTNQTIANIDIGWE